MDHATARRPEPDAIAQTRQSPGPVETAVRVCLEKGTLPGCTTDQAGWLRWRSGDAHDPRVYVQVGEHPHEDDSVIGTMSSPALAVSVVHAHNSILREVDTWQDRARARATAERVAVG